ncbi:hypothetical protein [Halarsenatibacter silvermanii]|uniref:Transcriptional regulator, CopG family n=1 Tax=Halarsenatibacter silvermanii TaxID=321763 RepID=A0A1G9NE97_9FIRM|nr:hypothetical protein [Halarsenatibacter silvermanii]SDL84790.1 transcriptional regulator, CopG family [Halarsenatibacter silvermanii]
MGKKEWCRVKLPSNLLQEMEGYVTSGEESDIDEFFCQALKMYLAHLKKDEIKRKLKSGYKEMSELNEQLADEGLPSSCRTITFYEEKLSECE